ncbi:MAG TPA: alpha/beta hydrolase [Acidimicrobiales bacterium]|nr:alpha/beta hydrolase [Acidimicrobiales bacterium]
MRAVVADADGAVTRDGITVRYERHGSAAPSLVLLPTWSLVHARHWKLQVPYLARHYSVLSFDGRGNGRSDRPTGLAAYDPAEFAADTLAVMDATETERAVLVSVSRGVLWSLRLCAEHPERVLGAIFIDPIVPFAFPPAQRALLARFDEPVVEDPVGWEKYKAAYWKADYPDFVDFFIGRMFTEPHSTKQHEDAVAWALETDPATMIATNHGLRVSTAEVMGRLADRVRCPTLVIHGSRDAICRHSQGVALAERTRGALVTLEGSGHCPHLRDPVRVNLLIRRFVEGLGR